MRLLEYTGIVRKEKEAVLATGSEVGTRYEIKIGCVLALENSPLQKGLDIAINLKLSLVTEYGMKNQLFQDLSLNIKQESDSELRKILCSLLDRPIDELDLSEWQKKKLKENKLLSIKDVLDTSEEDIQNTIPYIGQKRARRIRNAAIAEILEYLSG